NSEDYEKFRDALSKLRLNDSALHYEPEVSGALGFGFRCGFLGLLHMDIVQERLEREYELTLVTGAPTVVYEVARAGGAIEYVDNPAKLHATGDIAEIREPIIVANILVPPDHVGAVLKLCTEKRGTQNKMLYLGTQVSLQYQLPLAEVVLDFFDRLKSASRGYASFDYEFSHFQAAPLVKLDILINGDPVDALSIIVHRDSAYQRGRELVDKMQALMPLIVLLSWLALPVTVVCIVDDWLLRPQRSIAASARTARDAPLMRLLYGALPVLIVAAVLRLLLAERLDFSAVLLAITVAT